MGEFYIFWDLFWPIYGNIVVQKRLYFCGINHFPPFAIYLAAGGGTDGLLRLRLHSTHRIGQPPSDKESTYIGCKKKSGQPVSGIDTHKPGRLELRFGRMKTSDFSRQKYGTFGQKVPMFTSKKSDVLNFRKNACFPGCAYSGVGNPCGDCFMVFGGTVSLPLEVISGSVGCTVFEALPAPLRSVNGSRLSIRDRS